MKNKKLIATVASLCLVLVAVVAAVVGVLAAANQQVVNKIKVGYQAKANVYATVSLNGKTEFTNYGTAATTTFYTVDQQESRELSFAYGENALAISENNNHVPGKFALYQFKFENLNPTYALDVQIAYKEKPSSGENANNWGDEANNVRLFWVASSDGSYTVTTSGDNPTLSYDNAGHLTTTGNLSGQISFTSGSSKVYDHSNSTPNAVAAFGNDQQAAAGSVQYIYLIVAVIDLNADATFDMDGTNKSLTIDLAGYRPTTPSNNG